MAKKGGGKRAKVDDLAVLDEIRKPGASLDDPLPDVDWSTDKDMFARLDGWSIVDEIFAYDWSALDKMLAYDWSALDEMFAPLVDWSTLDAMFPVDLTLDRLDGLFQPIDKAMGKRRPRRTGGKPPR